MKILVYIFLPIVMLFCFPSFSIAELNADFEGTFNIFTTQNATITDTTTVDSGMGYIIKGKLCNLNKTLKQLNSTQIRGVSVEFDSSKNEVEKLISKYRIRKISAEELETTSFIYGYTPYLPLYSTIDGKKINIQIAYSDNHVKIGYPLILDGV
ncbi:MAG: hypothetical protein IKQ31_00705 [Clostridia bacterium]|nr:hypothetical protein [Clostridia bacterium]